MPVSKRVTASTALALVATITFAQAQVIPPNYHPQALAVSIPSAQAPTIDGDLSDPVWCKAKPIRDFYQIAPKEGAPATERTEVRILTDGTTLYIALKAYDSAPDKIVARVMQRDGDITKDDHIRIYLDPNHKGRDGFVFGVSPTGARYDALLMNNSEFLDSWNAIWTAKTRITQEGWQAEIAIPLRSLSFRQNADWGLDIWRTIRRKSEYVRWSNINKTLNDYNISQEGTLSGIQDTDTGIGMDVQTFALGRYQYNDTGKSGFTLRPSGNVFYKLTPSLTVTATANTDFSDAPLDNRAVNTTRFSLFYPERRDFFLQDAPSFEFGGIPISDDSNAMPFLSRNIGILNGHGVNILGGAKVSGNEDGYGVGALSVRTAGTDETGEQQLSVLRLTAPVLESSKVGMIWTNGNPSGTSSNNVIGADFQYLDTHLAGDRMMQLDGYYTRSFDQITGASDAIGAVLNYPNEPWGAYFRFKQVGENFNPALGYVSRGGIRDYHSQFSFEQRYTDAPLRSFTLTPFLEGTTGLDNALENYDYGIMAQANSATDDTLTLKYYHYMDRPDADYTIPHAIVITAGAYNQNSFYTELVTSKSRPVYLDMTAQYDTGYYGGHRFYTDTIIKTSLSSNATFDIEHIMKMISVPRGDVTVHIGMVDTSWNFTPDMSLRTQLQYDNISRKFSTSLRYRWEWRPDTELLVVLGNDASLEKGYHTQTSAFSVRIGKTFRL